jgi:hypothetical protein
MKRRDFLLTLWGLTGAAGLPAAAFARGRRGNTGRGGNWRYGERQNRIIQAHTSDVHVQLGQPNPGVKHPIGSGVDLQDLHNRAMKADSTGIAPLADPGLLDAMKEAAASNRLQKARLLNLDR